MEAQAGAVIGGEVTRGLIAAITGGQNKRAAGGRDEQAISLALLPALQLNARRLGLLGKLGVRERR